MYLFFDEHADWVPPTTKQVHKDMVVRQFVIDVQTIKNQVQFNISKVLLRIEVTLALAFMMKKPV